MNFSLGIQTLRQILVTIALSFPIATYAQPVELASEVSDHSFSYSILETELDSAQLISLIQREILTKPTLDRGAIYALWVAAEKPVDAPFAGLADNQIGLMMAWPNAALSQVDVFDDTLRSLNLVTTISSRLFEAIYLPAGLEVPTTEGFYVHREEKYKLVDVSDAVRLSKEAWITWEPHWGVRVIGLFRELGSSADYSNLNRIVWYPSYSAWLDTRNFTEDMESAMRFRERRSMLIPGSGVAIATDRLLP